jgi:quercetin dioxygenase-like cupin family protein
MISQHTDWLRKRFRRLLTPHAGPTSSVLASWSTIPIEHVADGIERQMIWGERLMVCRLRFAPGTITAVHTHVHEQITLVEQGRVAFTIDGQTRVAAAGDVLFFPSRLSHGATMLEDEVVLIDIFSPVREDFLPK